MDSPEWAAQALPCDDGAQLRLWRPNLAERPARLHFAHATGFHAHTYAPLFAALGADLPLAAWDMRGHGHSGPAGDPERFAGWARYAADLGGWLRAQPGPVWLAGHSVGATVSAMAAAAQPERVAGLILIEPVLVPPLPGLLLRLGQLLDRPNITPLSAGARRRRDRFVDHAQALAAWRGRGAFRSWPEEWLLAYVRHALEPDPGGAGLRLRCRPEFEGRSFDRTLAWPWGLLRRLPQPPLVLLGGCAQSTTGEASRRALRRVQPRARLRVWPQASHFLPMEHTAEVAAAIRAAMAGGRVADA